MSEMTTPVDPFSAPGVWLKAQLHAHTTESDGDLSPEALLRHYAWLGYDVVALTDHWKVTHVDGDHGVVTILGAELNADIRERDTYCDLLVYGVSERPDPSLVSTASNISADDGTDAIYESFPSIQAGVDWTREQGGVAILAHPWWSGVRNPDVLGVSGLSGIEIFNGTAEYESDRADGGQLWDEGVEDGLGWTGIATDDSHYPGFDLDRGWVWLRASERSADAALRAIRDGSFYASSGPVIEGVSIAQGTITVRCSPATGVTLHGDPELGAGAWTRPAPGRLLAEPLAADPDGALREVRLEVPEETTWARVVVHDANGRKAWTNPLPIQGGGAA